MTPSDATVCVINIHDIDFVEGKFSFCLKKVKTKNH